MIGAILIHFVCYVFMLKGVPFYLHNVLSLISTICAAVALLVWEQTKDRLKALEKELRKKGGT